MNFITQINSKVRKLKLWFHFCMLQVHHILKSHMDFTYYTIKICTLKSILFCNQIKQLRALHKKKIRSKFHVSHRTKQTTVVSLLEELLQEWAYLVMVNQSSLELLDVQHSVGTEKFSYSRHKPNLPAREEKYGLRFHSRTSI